MFVKGKKIFCCWRLNSCIVIVGCFGNDSAIFWNGGRKKIREKQSAAISTISVITVIIDYQAEITGLLFSAFQTRRGFWLHPALFGYKHFADPPITKKKVLVANVYHLWLWGKKIVFILIFTFHSKTTFTPLSILLNMLVNPEIPIVCINS